MARLAVIADDLTGANDTAVQFAKRDISACVQVDFKQEIDGRAAEVLVINTDSRDMQQADAYEAVRRAAVKLKEQNIKYIYKKVDSTLRGNFGSEIAAADDVFQPELVVIAPAFPKNKRLTIGGYHLLHGMPIELTELANAPKTPVRESFIASLIEQQTGRKCALISFLTMKKGVTAVRREVAEALGRGERWIIFDIVRDEDFELLMESLHGYDDVLWAGSAGLANYLPQLLPWSEKKQQSSGQMARAALIIAGSVSHTTQTQIAEFRKNVNAELVKVNVAALLENRPAELYRCAAAVNDAAAAGGAVLIASAVNDSDVAKAVQAGKIHNLGSREVSEYTAQALAELAKMLDMQQIGGLVLTGGDTAVHVLKALGAVNIEIMNEVAPGIPLGVLQGGSCDGMKVVTKAGAFGDKDCFIKAVQALGGESV